MKGMLPIKRFGKSEDIGKAAAFLVADDAGDIAGSGFPLRAALPPEVLKGRACCVAIFSLRIIWRGCPTSWQHGH